MADANQTNVQQVHSTSYPAQIASFCAGFPSAHLVACGYKGNRKAAAPGWNKPAPHGAIRRHAEANLVGLIPASIGLTVVDVDEGNPLALALGLLPEYFTLSGTPGRGHLWFLDDESRNNWKWEYKSRAGAIFSGEIRGGHGYVVLWEPWILTSGHTFPDVTEVSRPFGDVEHWLKPAALPAPPVAPLPSRRTARRGPGQPLERAIEVIAAIAPDDYDTWIAVGQCLEGSARKGEFAHADAFRLWRNWSARSPGKFPGDGAMAQKWASFKGGSARTLGSLVVGRTA